MAMHEYLIANLVASARRQPLPYPGVANKGGSVNYRLMEAAKQALLGNWGPLLAILAEMREVGHLTLAGPRGAATEAAAPGPHDYFNTLSLAAPWQRAAKDGKADAERALELAIGDELALARAFRVGQVSSAPSARGKDEKGQGPASPLRDVMVALLLDEPLPPGNARNRRGPWWSEPYGMSAAILRDMLSGPAGAARRDRLRAAPEPRLYVPIHKAELSGGGHLAWLDDSPAARVSVIDPINWVRAEPGRRVECGYNWSEVPEVPAGAVVRVVGAR